MKPLAESVNEWGLPLEEADRKLATCPNCGPKSRFTKNFDDGEWVWRCTNCLETKPMGAKRKSPKLVRAALDKIKQAVEKSGSDSFPVKIEEWKEEEQEDGSVDLTVSGYQGEKDNLLGMTSHRMFGISISPVGKISVYYDSKARTETERRSTEQQLKAGRLYVW